MNKRDTHILEQEGRVPPQAVEVEESVLGSMLMEDESAYIAFEMISKDDLYKPAHQHIFDAMYNLFVEDKSIDLLMVENWLRDEDLLEACGGSGYLADLTRSASSSANIEYHCAIIDEKSKRRDLILGCTQIIKEAYRSDNDTYDVLDRAEHRIFEINQTKQSSEAEHINEYLEEYLSEVSAVREDPDNRIGMMTGLDIDNMIPGFKPGQLIILAARPSMGKTAMALTIANKMAAGHGGEEVPVGFLSMEMGKKELVGRIINMEGHTNGQQAEKGNITDEQFRRMMDASGRLMNRPVYVDDTPGQSLIDARSKTRKMVKKHGVKLIIVDYLQLMQYNGTANTREQEISAISRGLKQVAKSYDVPVIALSQLSRAVEQRGGDKRPILSDLRESGAIEQDADIVMFLYRPEYYGIKTTPGGQSTEGLAEVIIKKQRNGPTGTIPLRFIKEHALFENGAFNSRPKKEPEPKEDSPF